MLNPAVAGSYSYWNVKMGYRKQWVGMEGAPRTMFVSLHGAINHPEEFRTRRRVHKPHHGVGGYIFSDKTGPISYNGAFFSYAYHIKMNRHVTFSIGSYAGLKEFRLNADELYFVETPDDDMVPEGISSTIIPDANFGFWMYSDDFFVGASIHQLLQSSLKIDNPLDEENAGMLFNHYFLSAGVKLKFSHEWSFVPSIMVKHVSPAPTQVDINGAFMYKDIWWVGMSYRHLDALAIVAEYDINDTWEIGAAIDLTTFSKLRHFNYGTYEVILGYRWGGPKKKLTCPAKFW